MHKQVHTNTHTGTHIQEGEIDNLYKPNGYFFFLSMFLIGSIDVHGL